MSVIWSGYITISKEAKKQHERFKKEHPELTKFIEECADFLDVKFSKGEVNS